MKVVFVTRICHKLDNFARNTFFSLVSICLDFSSDYTDFQFCIAYLLGAPPVVFYLLIIVAGWIIKVINHPK